MSGCEGCLQSQKYFNEQFAIVRQQAKELALKLNSNVFIYKTPEGVGYMVEEAARAEGIQPTIEVVSPLQPVTT